MGDFSLDEGGEDVGGSVQEGCQALGGFEEGVLEGFFVEAGRSRAPVACGGLVDVVVMVRDEAGETDELTREDVSLFQMGQSESM